MPRLRNEWGYTSSPPVYIHGVHNSILTVIFTIYLYFSKQVTHVGKVAFLEQPDSYVLLSM